MLRAKLARLHRDPSFAPSKTSRLTQALAACPISTHVASCRDVQSCSTPYETGPVVPQPFDALFTQPAWEQLCSCFGVACSCVEACPPSWHMPSSYALPNPTLAMRTISRLSPNSILSRAAAALECAADRVWLPQLGHAAAASASHAHCARAWCTFVTRVQSPQLQPANGLGRDCAASSLPQFPTNVRLQ